MSWRVEGGQQNAAQTSDTSLKTTLNSAMSNHLVIWNWNLTNQLINKERRKMRIVSMRRRISVGWDWKSEASQSQRGIVTSCRAVVLPRFGGPEVLEVRPNVEVPDLKPNEVLVRARAVSVNPLDTRVSHLSFISLLLCYNLLQNFVLYVIYILVLQNPVCDGISTFIT